MARGEVPTVIMIMPKDAHFARRVAHLARSVAQAVQQAGGDGLRAGGIGKPISLRKRLGSKNVEIVLWYGDWDKQGWRHRNTVLLDQGHARVLKGKYVYATARIAEGVLCERAVAAGCKMYVGYRCRPALPAQGSPYEDDYAVCFNTVALGLVGGERSGRALIGDAWQKFDDIVARYRANGMDTHHTGMAMLHEAVAWLDGRPKVWPFRTYQGGTP